ncbi:hypothetical protein G7046_g839 [Stylonectria norvegica]|nr:hypothetical protein G7046_g839 [Stylonectria norvegica]
MAVNLDADSSECPFAVLQKYKESLYQPTPKAYPTIASIPPTSASRLAEAAEDAADEPDRPKSTTYLYLAYGSNLSAETFLGMRGIRPLSQTNVNVPTLQLTFDLPGLPYREPCFANVAFRKIPTNPKLPDPTNPPKVPPFDPNPPFQPPHATYGSDLGGLVGVVYEVTEEDYRTIIRTEGGGASYKEIIVPCLAIPPKMTIPEKPPVPELPKPFLARTLYAPFIPESNLPDDPRKKKWWYRFITRPQRDPNYSEASARYLKLITDGAREHDLPDDYQAWLGSLRPYTITEWPQMVGQMLFLGTWGFLFLLMLGLSKIFADKDGHLPKWLTLYTTVLFNVAWKSCSAGRSRFRDPNPSFFNGFDGALRRLGQAVRPAPFCRASLWLPAVQRAENAEAEPLNLDFILLPLSPTPLPSASLLLQLLLYMIRPLFVRRSLVFKSLRVFTSRYSTIPIRNMAGSALLGGQGKKHKVTIVGSGNWGSTIAKIVAENTRANSNVFEEEVQMWVFEEEVTISKDSKHYDASIGEKPQKLTEVINTRHENVKYLPDIALPTNIVANPSIVDAVKDSTILIFNLPHQFIGNVCKQINGHILPYARGISCIKGVNVSDDGISLFSEWIGDGLGIYVGALSGANLAREIAAEKWSETTVAYDPPVMDNSRAPSPQSSSSDLALTNLQHKDARGRASKTKLTAMPAEYPPLDQDCFRILFHRPYFHVQLVSDVAGVSLSGALKNIVALAAGFVDGRGWGDNAKAAIMRIGLMEMVKFGKEFFGETVQTATFTESSAGVADLITSCSGGRNFRCAKISVEKGLSVQEVEAQELNGQKIQGTTTAEEVNSFLKARKLEGEYPLFTAVNDILHGKRQVDDIPNLMSDS